VELTLERRTASWRATERLGEMLGAAARGAPAVIGLSGGLGAGKTCLVRGLVRGLGSADADLVCSPTYAIANAYSCTPPIFHLDLYRLGSADDLEAIAFEEMLGGTVLIEWFDRIAEVYRIVDLVVRIEQRGPRARTFWFEARSPRGRGIVARLGQVASN
jgi:tRNA threonylcarbamoyl adenosine modification protein YjeE